MAVGLRGRGEFGGRWRRLVRISGKLGLRLGLERLFGGRIRMCVRLV